MEPERQQTESPTVAATSRALVAIVAFGLGLRIYHYLRNPGVWMDELFLLRNIVGKSYSELLGPLVCDQAAPPLFLWLEHTVWFVLGDSTFALRLIPLLASCGALLLLAYVARHCLRGDAVVWALLLFASSDKLVDHTVEAKQYLMDAFVAVAVPAVFLCTRHWTLGRRSLLFAALAPVVVLLSFPGCFVMGGLLLAMLPEVWSERRTIGAWLGYALVAVATFAAFAFLVMGPIRAQHTPALANFWTDSFPNWDDPWTVPLWCVRSNIGVLDHAFRPLGGILALFAILGAVSLWRRGCKTELLLVASPILLVIIAAGLRAYPYESRVTLFAVGPLALLIGEGTGVVLAALRQYWQQPSTWARRTAASAFVAVAIILLLPTCLSLYHAINPWPRVIYPWPEPAYKVAEYSRN
jgi:hypothetical protein